MQVNLSNFESEAYKCAHGQSSEEHLQSKDEHLQNKDDEFEPFVENTGQNEEDVPIEDPIDVATSILEKRTILELYRLKFPVELEIYKDHDLKQLDLEDLDELRTAFDIIIGSKSALYAKQKMFFTAIYGIERLTVKTNLMKVDGLTKMLFSDEDFNKDICRLSLKYLSSAETKPEVTVAIKLVSTMIQLNEQNETKEAFEKARIKIAAINQKFSHL